MYAAKTQTDADVDDDVYLDGWICRYESEFSKALSQWILLTIKGFVLIYWVVIIKTGINKQCIQRTIKGRCIFFSLSISLSLCSYFLSARVFLLLKWSEFEQNIVGCLLVTSDFMLFFLLVSVSYSVKSRNTLPIQFILSKMAKRIKKEVRQKEQERRYSESERCFFFSYERTKRTHS